MKEGELPLNNWIWFGLHRREGGVCGYTYGMDVFGKEELEVLDADADPLAVREFLVSLAGYVIGSDVTLNDGETIGFSQGDRHRITRSPGVALPDQPTLKGVLSSRMRFCSTRPLLIWRAFVRSVSLSTNSMPSVIWRFICAGASSTTS